MPSCESTFNAVSQAASKNPHDKIAVTGVGAVKCGRHALVRPSGVADLTKGEKWVLNVCVFGVTDGSIDM